MTIKTITYERLHSFGSYHNERYSLTADIGEDDHAEDVFHTLEEIAAERIRLSEQKRERAEKDRQLFYDVSANERKIEKLKEQAVRIKAFLDKHGVPVDRAMIEDDDLPF